MSEQIHLFGRAVSSPNPTLVIAEIGVNHDGSVERALEMVDLAKAAGADAVKLQIFKAHSLMHASSDFAGYQRQRARDEDPVAMLRRYELTTDELWRIVESARDKGLIPLATPFSIDDVKIIHELGLPAVKIASPDLVNLPLLVAAASIAKPLMISTGASCLQEVDASVAWLRERKVPFALLHCVSSYPVTPQDANICWIPELATRYGVPVGFSDHTTETMSGAMAVAAGACIIEKHLTYNQHAPGPDHAASADPIQFAEYVRAIRLSERLRGKPGKRILEAEQDVRRVSRQSLVVCRALRPGDLLRREDLIVQRPGTGIPAAEIERLVGATVVQSLEPGTLLQWSMIRHAA